MQPTLLIALIIAIIIGTATAKESVCSAWGEGHVITFDQLKYDTFAVGEHTYIKSNNFNVITRSMKVHCEGKGCLDDGEPASIFAVGFKYRTTTLEIYAIYGNLRIIVNGKKKSFSGDKWTAAGNNVEYKVTQFGYAYLKFPGAIRAMVHSSWGDDVSFKVWLPESQKGKVSGMCGQFDGNSAVSHELIGQDDRKYPLETAIAEYYERSALKFVQSWRTKHRDQFLEKATGWDYEEYEAQLAYQKTHQINTKKVQPWASEAIRKAAIDQCAILKKRQVSSHGESSANSQPIFYLACLFDIREGLIKLNKIAKLVDAEQTIQCDSENRGLCRHDEHIKILKSLHKMKVSLLKEKYALIGHNSKRARDIKRKIGAELFLIKRIEAAMTGKS